MKIAIMVTLILALVSYISGLFLSFYSSRDKRVLALSGFFNLLSFLLTIVLTVLFIIYLLA